MAVHRGVGGTLLATALVAGAATAGETILYVSPQGADQWSGRTAEANADRTDGPLATLAGARDALRRLRAGGAATQFTVCVRGGRGRVKSGRGRQARP